MGTLRPQFRGSVMVRSVFTLLISIAVIGCGSVTKNGALGGVVGGGVGAGTGALIGSVISNGDVAASALAGGAVGIPVGIALGVALSSYDSEVQEQRLIARYLAQQDSIVSQEAEIQQLREEVLTDSPSNPLYNQGVRRPFNGTTVGSN